MITQTTSKSIAGMVVVYLLLAAFSTGCSNIQLLSDKNGEPTTTQIAVGDEITVIQYAGTVVTMTVGAISDEGISGDNEFVAFDDMRQVYRWRTAAANSPHSR